MNVILNKFHTLSESNNSILLDHSFEILPIVWNRDGEYCIIPHEVVANTVDVMAMQKLDYSRKRVVAEAIIMWSQGIPISNLVGRALIGE